MLTNAFIGGVLIGAVVGIVIGIYIGYIISIKDQNKWRKEVNDKR